MICWEQVAQLHKDIGADCFAEIVEAFILEMDEATALLAQTHDAAEQRTRLHFLKGSALTLGFTEFAYQCASFESAAINAPVSADDRTQLIGIYQVAKSEFLAGLAAILDRPMR